MQATDTYVSPGKAALRLGKNPRTISRRADGLTAPDVITTPGGHRRIALRVVEQWANETEVAA